MAAAIFPATPVITEPAEVVSTGPPGVSAPQLHFNLTFPGDTSIFGNPNAIAEELSRFRFADDDNYLGQMSDDILLEHGLLHSFAAMQIWHDCNRRYTRLINELSEAKRLYNKALADRKEATSAAADAIRLQIDTKSELEDAQAEIERLRGMVTDLSEVRAANDILEADKVKLVADLDEIKRENLDLSESLDQSRRRADGLSKVVARLEKDKFDLEHRYWTIADYATVKTAAEVYREVDKNGVDSARLKAAEDAYDNLKVTLLRLTSRDHTTTSFEGSLSETTRPLSSSGPTNSVLPTIENGSPVCASVAPADM